MVKFKDESLFIDFEYADGEIPDGFAASYVIERGGRPLRRGELSLNGEGTAFLLRIEAGALEALECGVYRLMVAVANDALGYKDYIYNEELVIEEPTWAD